MFICITHIDAGTGILCTEAPMANGPVFPDVKGLNVEWWNQSTWPVQCTPEGVYTVAPKYYGTCSDDADTTVVGVLEVLTEADYLQRKRTEFYARQPYPSWIFDENTLRWNPPVQYPQDGQSYQWDEATTSWSSSQA